MTPSEVLLALSKGEKLRVPLWPEGEYVYVDQKGRLLDEEGEWFSFEELLSDSHKIKIYIHKLTDEELTAEWEKESRDLLSPPHNTQARHRSAGNVLARCARQLRERKL